MSAIELDKLIKYCEDVRANHQEILEQTPNKSCEDAIVSRVAIYTLGIVLEKIKSLQEQAL